MIKIILLASLLIMALVLGSQVVKAEPVNLATQKLFEEICSAEAHLDISEAMAHCPKSIDALESGILSRVIDNESKTGKITTFKEILGMVK